jgi:hypothetical protein
MQTSLRSRPRLWIAAVLILSGASLRAADGPNPAMAAMRAERQAQSERTQADYRHLFEQLGLPPLPALPPAAEDISTRSKEPRMDAQKKGGRESAVIDRRYNGGGAVVGGSARFYRFRLSVSDLRLPASGF